MPRHKLEFDLPETDFLLFGISSQSKDYRLAWYLNKSLGLALKRKADISPDEHSRFAHFFFENKMNRLKYHLIGMKNKGQILVKELKQIDYLLLIEGNYTTLDPDNFLFQLKNVESILAAYTLNPQAFRSKVHFVLG